MHKIIIFTLIILFALSSSLCIASEVKKEDKNNDSNPDMWIYYDNNQRPIKIESDRDYDGKLDLWIFYGEKGQRRTEVDMNFDARPDMYSYYQYGQRVKLEIDSDYDGKLDQVNEYRDNRLVKMQRANKDGKLETVFDISGRYSPQQKHTEYYETNPKALEHGKTLPEKQKAK
jgi:DNA polymerase sigma